MLGCPARDAVGGAALGRGLRSGGPSLYVPTGAWINPVVAFFSILWTQSEAGPLDAYHRCTVQGQAAPSVVDRDDARHRLRDFHPTGLHPARGTRAGLVGHPSDSSHRIRSTVGLCRSWEVHDQRGLPSRRGTRIPPVDERTTH